jgi:HEAT repeat protein
MEPLTPQVMHKLVFTILVHGLPDSQTQIAHDVLLEAQRNPHPQVRELAVVALAELPVPAQKRVAALVAALADPAGRVRRRAARALGDFGTQAAAAIPELVIGLRDPDPSVRRDSAGTLGRFGAAAANGAPGLVNLLGEPDTRLRIVAATALKRIGRAALPALLDGLASLDYDLRSRCGAVLKQIAPGDDMICRVVQDAELDAEENPNDTAIYPMPVALGVA